MTAFVHHFSFEFRSGVRNKSLMLLNYLFPLGFYLMASALMVSVNPTFRDNLIPAMIFFTILTSTLLGLPDPLVNARESGILRSYKIHGIPQISILLIPVLTTILHTTIVSAFIIVSAPLLFQAPLPTNGLSFVLAYLLMAFSCAGIALLIGVLAPSSRATVLMGQAIFLPSMMIGGLMFPAHLLPDALRKLSLLLPSTHAMNALNGWVEGDLLTLNPYISVGVLYAGGVLAFLTAAYLFNWDSQNRTRRIHPAFALVAFIPFVAGVILSFA